MWHFGCFECRVCCRSLAGKASSGIYNRRGTHVSHLHTPSHPLSCTHIPLSQSPMQPFVRVDEQRVECETCTLPTAEELEAMHTRRSIMSVALEGMLAVHTHWNAVVMD